MNLASASFQNDAVITDSELALEEIELLKQELAAGYDSPKVRALLARVTLSTTFQFTGLLDLEGRHLQPSIAANRATGVNSLDVLGKPIWDHPCWQDMSEMQLNLKEAISKASQGEFVRFDATHQIGNSIAVFDFSLNPVRDRAGNIVFITAEGRDVTEQRHLENQVKKQKEELAQLDKLKTQFFTNISHEFRTPLTLILGPLEEAISELETCDIDTQHQRLQTAERNAHRLLKLVNQLLDFSALEANRLQPTYQLTNLSILTQDLASMFRSAIENAGITFIVDCPPCSQPVYVDCDMWEKIVMNLLSNAFKHTFEGKIELRLYEENNSVCLRVQDTGVGIPSEQLPKLFERFYRVPEAPSRTHEGSGIGLALVQELVKLHGGIITVESILNQGTAFTINIPTDKAHLSAGEVRTDIPLKSKNIKAESFISEMWNLLPDLEAEHDKHTPEEGAVWYKTLDGDKVRILLAEDNADMRKYIERLLSIYCDIESVPDGYAALLAARRSPPDLILSDIMMPKMDGLQLLSAIRTDTKLKSIPIILLSARAGEESEIQGLQMGANDYVIKPFDKRALVAKIKANLNLELHQVTQEAQAAKQLMETRFHRLVSCNIIGFFTGQLQNGLITSANDYVLNFLGYTRSELQQGILNWKKLTPPEYTGMDESKINEFLDQGYLLPFEKQYFHKDGHRVDVLLGVAKSEGFTEDLVCYVLDISAQKQAEQERITYMKRLEQSNQELEQFATIASHDLNEPLRKIMIFSEMLSKITPQDGQDYIQRLQAAVSRMQNLITDLLNLSRVNRKGKPFKPVDLNALVQTVLEDLQIALRETQGQVLIEDLARVQGDEGQIHQLLQNLISNALKYHRDDTSPVVKIHGVFLPEHRGYQVTVEDNGIGIKSEYYERIFEPFQRLHGINAYPGTGMGLTICKKIVERHNGSISVESQFGQGSQFSFTLPVPESYAVN